MNATLTSAVVAPTPPSLSAWIEDLLAALPAALPPAAGDQLRQAPLPSRRLEAWRFTDPAPLTTIEPRRLADPDPLAAAPALPAGVSLLAAEDQASALAALPQAVAADWPLLLNQALAPRLLALRVRGRAAAPLELLSDSGAQSGVLPLRILLILEPGAELELLQVHRAAGAALASVRVDVVLAAGARLHHGLLAQGCQAASLLASLHVEQAEGSHYTLAQVSGGWGLARVEPKIHQGMGAAHTRLRGLQVVAGRQCADTHSQVRFDGPDGSLDQLHRAVVAGTGRSVFNGAVVVPRAAQRTDAAQLSRSLLLSERGRVDAKPELEIVADDVRCSHGATVSRLQQDELFYLQSRGIAADQAARLLLRGFCADVIEALPAAAAAWQPLASLLPEEVA